jgi:hypothetical protein
MLFVTLIVFQRSDAQATESRAHAGYEQQVPESDKRDATP